MPQRSNFRQLLFVGRDARLQSGFGSRIYIVGSRNRTVYVAHGATDVKDRKAYPKWLLHHKIAFGSSAAAYKYAEDTVNNHLERDYTIMRGKMRSPIRFADGEFHYTRVDGTRTTSTPKRKKKSKD